METKHKRAIAGVIGATGLAVGLQICDWWAATVHVPGVALTYGLHGFDIVAPMQHKHLDAFGSLAVVSPLCLWLGTVLALVTAALAIGPLFGFELDRRIGRLAATAALIELTLVIWVIAMVPPFGIQGWLVTFSGERQLGCVVALVGAIGAIVTGLLTADVQELERAPPAVLPPARPTGRTDLLPPAASTISPVGTGRPRKDVAPIEIDFGTSSSNDPFDPHGNGGGA